MYVLAPLSEPDVSVGKLSEESPFFGLRVSHSEQAAEDIHQSPEALPEVVEAISESNLSTTSARAGSDDAISTDPSVFKYLDASLPEQALAVVRFCWERIFLPLWLSPRLYRHLEMVFQQLLPHLAYPH